MHAIFIALIVLALLAILGVLATGIVGLFRGQSPRQSNRLMWYRVALQFAALVLMALLMLTVRS